MWRVKPRTVNTGPDYAAACRQTVTLYNNCKEAGATKYHKTVFVACAFLESKRVEQESRTGVTAANKSLLVIPARAGDLRYLPPPEFEKLADKAGYWTLRAGDKACSGTGPDIETPAEWAAFTEAAWPGVVVLSAVDLKCDLDGRLLHLEGGG